MILNYNITNFLKENSINDFFLLAIPFFLITGPFLPDLSLVLIVLFGIIKFNNKIFYIIKKNSIIFLILVFSLYNIINSFLSEQIITSLKSSITYLRFPLFAIISSFILSNNKNLYSQFLFFIKLLLLFLSCDAIFQFIFHYNFFGFEAVQKNRISGMFGDEYILGSYLSRLFPIYLFLNFYTKGETFKNIKEVLFITIIVFLAILISGERTSLCIISIFLFISFVLIKDQNYRKFVKVFLFIILIAISLLLTFSKSLKTRYIYLTFGQVLNFNIGNLKQEDINNQNLLHLKVSYQMFKDQPLNGFGNKMFGYKCFKDYFVNDGRCSNHPHNFLAQILVETGIIGLLLFFTIYLFIIKEIIFFKKKSNYSAILLLTIILINFFPLIPSGNFFNNWLNIQFYFPIAFYISLKHNEYFIKYFN